MQKIQGLGLAVGVFFGNFIFYAITSGIKDGLGIGLIAFFLVLIISYFMRKF